MSYKQNVGKDFACAFLLIFSIFRVAFIPAYMEI